MTERQLEGQLGAQSDRRSGEERRRQERRVAPVAAAVLAVSRERRRGERRSGRDRRAVSPAVARRRARPRPGATAGPKSKQEIIDDLDSYIRNGGGGYGAWCVGTASDAGDRLFHDHGVRENSDLWIYRRTSFSGVAREIEEYFVRTLGTAGGTGKGVVFTDTVYAYKKAPHTNP